MSELKQTAFSKFVYDYEKENGSAVNDDNTYTSDFVIYTFAQYEKLLNTRTEPQVIEANNRKVLPLNNLYRNQLLDNRGEKAHECVINSAQSPYAMIDNKLFEKCFSEWVPTQDEIDLFSPKEIDRDDVYAWCRNVLNMYLGLVVCKNKEKQNGRN